MKLHGLVVLGLLALAKLSLADDQGVPRQLDAFDSPPPPLTTTPQPAFPSAPGARAPESTSLEAELEALRADVQAFHHLSDEVARSARAAEADADRTMNRQRQEILDILSRLATQGIAKARASRTESPVVPPPTLSNVPETIAAPSITDDAVDHFALGKVLFRAGEFAKSEQAFRKAPVSEDNRLILKYLIATCLRKQSKWQAALEGYREIATTDKDPVLRDLARFQIDGIRWNQETEQQLEQLRKQREQQSSSRRPQ